MRKVFFPIIALLLYLTYGVFLSQFDLRLFPPELYSENPNSVYDYRGVINVHSSLSTGSRTVDEIKKAALDSSLDFIIFTDLNLFESKVDYEGYDRGLLVISGAEYSYLNSRVMHIDYSSDFTLSGLGQAQSVIEEILSKEERDQGAGALILSHPFRPDYEWSGEYPLGLDGLEIVNLKSMWQKAWEMEKASFFWTLFIYPFNERLSLLRLLSYPKAETGLWDELLSSRKIFGVSGVDAEAKVPFGGQLFVEFPSYESLFGLATNHILISSELTGDKVSDRKKVLSAFRKGQFYMSIDYLANPKGFNAQVVSSSGEKYLMGSEIPFKEGLVMEIDLPQKPRFPFDVKILKDGVQQLISNDVNTRFEIKESGVYRVEVRVIPTFPLPDGKKWIPWIFTNPFYISK